jgi:glycosyltransferase involved in cell wall biosynthesis
MAYFRSLQQLRQQLGVEDEMRFVFESGPDPDEPFIIELDTVGELFRVSDVMFMPSHREGFGMPVLEAGLVGLPIVCTAIPAAQEIGGSDVVMFNASQDPAQVADQILAGTAESPVHRLRQRVRQHYTWDAIFRHDIEPLLKGKDETG